MRQDLGHPIMKITWLPLLIYAMTDSFLLLVAIPYQILPEGTQKSGRLPTTFEPDPRPNRSFVHLILGFSFDKLKRLHTFLG